MLNVRFILLQAVFSKYGFITTMLIIVQQILSASSIIYLTKAISLIGNNYEVLKNIIIFFILIISPYIPVCVAQATMYKVVNNTHHKTVLINIDKLRYQTYLMRSDLKLKYISNLSRNSFMILNDYFTYIYRVFSLVLNIFFTILIITKIVSIEYLYSFIFSLILSFIFFKFITIKIEKSSILVENNLSIYASSIEKSWENVILGSSDNLNNYRKDLSRSSRNYYDSKLDNAFLQQISNFISALIALVPLAIVSIFLIHNNIAINSVLSAIMVNLTRMVGLFSFFGNLIFDITNFVNIKSRIKNMIDSFNLEENVNNIKNNIKPIYMNGEVVESSEKILLFFQKINNGRFTITGENGSGKTTLLHYLLMNLRDEAIFIPTTPSDLNWGFSIDKLSTGLQVYTVISNQIIDCSEKFILIDEWDANLDEKNTIILDNLLEKVSKNKVVVEIRHL